MPRLWTVDHLLIRHGFCIKGRHDSDLWRDDLNIFWGCLLVMTKLPEGLKTVGQSSVQLSIRTALQQRTDMCKAIKAW